MRAAREEAHQAHAWPNPTIGAEFENLAAPADPNGATARQTTVSVTQPFEIGGKRSARISVGEHNLAAAEARGRQTQIDYAGELADAYAAAEAAIASRTVAAEESAQAQDDLRAARALVQAGKEASLRETQAKANVSTATAMLQARTADMQAALEQLSLLAGVAEPFTDVTPSLLAGTTIHREAVGPSLDQSPSVLAAQAEHDALEAQVRLERKKPIPDIGLSAGARRYQGVGATGLVVGVTAAIPIFDLNQGAIHAAEARAEAGEARLEAARLRVAAARRTALTQIAAANARLAATTEGEAAAAEAYRLARIGYDNGKTALIELTATRRALSEARALTIEAQLARVRAQVALAGIDGRMPFGE